MFSDLKRVLAKRAEKKAQPVEAPDGWEWSIGEGHAWRYSISLLIEGDERSEKLRRMGIAPIGFYTQYFNRPSQLRRASQKAYAEWERRERDAVKMAELQMYTRKKGV